MPAKYFFIPGRKWKLSYAELICVLNAEKLKFEELFVCETFFVFDISADPMKMTALFNRLGGFIKYGRVIDGDVFEYLENEMLPTLQDRGEKVNFAVSAYYERIGRADRLKLLGMKIKNWLRDEEIKCRFVFNPKSTETPTVLLEKNDVVKTGFELVLLRRRQDVSYGFTLALQDYEGFSTRDFGRPNPNKEKGMLPPKLARMMVNFACPVEGQTLYDPFCGSGTILQEAALLGLKVVGSDIDPGAINETTANLKWLDSKFNISSRPKLFMHNTLKPFSDLPSIDIVVTEPYLGPVSKRPLTGIEFEDVVKELRPLYHNFMKNLSAAMDRKKVRRLVLVVPIFKVGQVWKELRFDVPNRFQITKISGKIGQSDLQWDRPHSIIRRQINIYEF